LLNQFRFSCAGEDTIADKQTRAANTNVSLMSLKEPNVAKTVKPFINPAMKSLLGGKPRK